jgi:hypothetical protein
MNGAITMTRLRATIDHFNIAKGCSQHVDEFILRCNIVNDNSTASDILNLSQANVFSLQFVCNGTCGLGGTTSRLQSQAIPQYADNLLIDVAKRTAISVEHLQIHIADVALLKAFAKSVDLRFR